MAELDLDSEKMFRLVNSHQSFQKKDGFLVCQRPSNFFDKVFNAGIHDQRTLTKFLMENFDQVNGPLDKIDIYIFLGKTIPERKDEISTYINQQGCGSYTG